MNPSQRPRYGKIDWLGKNSIPFVIVFTKSDKLGLPKVESHVALLRRELKKTWQTLPLMFITSAETAKGRTNCWSTSRRSTRAGVIRKGQGE